MTRPKRTSSGTSARPSNGCTGGPRPIPTGWRRPTSPDDVCSATRRRRGRLAPMRVATGEHAHNRVMFKQLLQADAISVCPMGACRLGGVDEVPAVLLMSPRIGRCRCARTREASGCASTCRGFDAIRLRHAVSGSLDGRHVASGPITCTSISSGRSRWRAVGYIDPAHQATSVTMRPDSLERFRFPDGPVWRARAALTAILRSRPPLRFGRLRLAALDNRCFAHPGGTLRRP